jgi:hypothetical protein
MDDIRPEAPPISLPWTSWALLLVAVTGFLAWRSGLLDPSQFRSPLPGARLRRRAYRVAVRAGLVDPPAAHGSPELRRAAARAHQRQTVRELRRHGRHAAYVLLRYQPGLDMDAIQRDLASRKHLNLRDAGILLGIMVDKAELLAAQTGGSDGSGMDDEARLVRLQQIAQDLAERAEADQRG